MSTTLSAVFKAHATSDASRMPVAGACASRILNVRSLLEPGVTRVLLESQVARATNNVTRIRAAGARASRIINGSLRDAVAIRVPLESLVARGRATSNTSRMPVNTGAHAHN